jgi:hypothetical protein
LEPVAWQIVTEYWFCPGSFFALSFAWRVLVLWAGLVFLLESRPNAWPVATLAMPCEAAPTPPAAAVAATSARTVRAAAASSRAAAGRGRIPAVRARRLADLFEERAEEGFARLRAMLAEKSLDRILRAALPEGHLVSSRSRTRSTRSTGRRADSLHGPVLKTERRRLGAFLRLL